MAQQNLIELVGTVGREPELKVLPGKEWTGLVYDPIIDDKVERTLTLDDREVRSFSLAVNHKGEDGEEITRWFQCSDWDDHARQVHKGFFVKVLGTLKINQVEGEDGETKVFRNFTVKKPVIVLARPTPPEQP
jgi:single-stranded DNA-binding protein